MTLQQLLLLMVEHKASDLYLTVDLPPTYRIDGVTRAAGAQAMQQQHLEAVVSSLLSEKQRAEFEANLEMNLAVSQPGIGRFRVNVFRQRGNPGVIVRRIRADIQTIDQLALPPQLKEIMQAKRGLILVVGGTGSGKSTSLAAMIDHWNSTYPGHIITIEDPIEFVHPHKKSVITQREVGMDTHSFAAALKNTLRQAPDVILIGEIRDTETMEAAITFAETGHLCLATLHANNANQALERVLNFFSPERHGQILLQLALNLRAIVSQRLVPAVMGMRAAAIEILRNTPRIADLINQGQISLLKTSMSEGVPDGMQTFDHALFLLFQQGRISYENALAHADSANDLRLRIKTAGLEQRPSSGAEAGLVLELKD